MKEIQLTQGKVALVDDEDFEWLSKYKWSARESRGWFYARYSRWNPRKEFLMHRMIVSCPDSMEVDHIDGNTLNNQKYNLRICTHSENGKNKSRNRNKGIGFKGVYLDKRYNSFSAKIRVGEKYIHLGTFEKPLDAALAYDAAAIKYYGKFAKLNFPH